MHQQKQQDANNPGGESSGSGLLQAKPKQDAGKKRGLDADDDKKDDGDKEEKDGDKGDDDDQGDGDDKEAAPAENKPKGE